MVSELVGVISPLTCFMLRSHQTFRPVLIVKLLGIMFMIRCLPTTFHTIICSRRCRRMVPEAVGVISPLNEKPTAFAHNVPSFHGSGEYNQWDAQSCARRLSQIQTELLASHGYYQGPQLCSIVMSRACHFCIFVFL
jgi:hypothetical protein